MSNTRRVYGRRRLLFFRSKYDYGTIEIGDGEIAIVHVFVAPQDLRGLEIACMDPVEEDHGTTVGGDVMIGNPDAGYFNVPFEIWHRDGKVTRCLIGTEEFQLERGSVFVIGRGYTVAQVDCHSFEEALNTL